MIHDPKDPNCKGCRDKTDTAHPLLQEIFWECIKPAFSDAHVSWGWRSQLEQDRFVREGKSKTPWPLSKHNVENDGKPCSLAIDLFQITPEGKGAWPYKWYLDIWKELLKHKYPLRWGGTFKKWRDANHYEIFFEL